MYCVKVDAMSTRPDLKAEKDLDRSACRVDRVNGICDECCVDAKENGRGHHNPNVKRPGKIGRLLHLKR